MTGETGTVASAQLGAPGPPPSHGRSRGVSLDLHFWTQIDTINLLPTQIVQGDSHHLILAADFDHAEELQAVTGGAIGFQVIGDTEELDLRPKGVIELVRAKGPGVERAGNEFPEGVEVSELGLRRVVEMGCSIVYVGRQPDVVLDGIVLDGLEQVCQLHLAPKRRAITVGPRLKAQNVRHLQTKWHVTGNHLPGGPGVEQGAFQPLYLGHAEKGRRSTTSFLTILRVGTAVATLVEHEAVEGGTIAEGTIEARRVL